MRPVHSVMVFALAAAVAACSGSAGASAPSAASATPGGASSAPAAASGSSGDAGSSGPIAITGTDVAPGGQLCALLAPGDFAAQGVDGATELTINGDGTTEAYCSFTAKSSAQGGIEFDAFVGSDAQSTYANVLGSSNAPAGAQDATAKLSNVDAAQINLKDEGGSATIAVRAGKLVFDIGFPSSDKAESQLLALAGLVLQRAAALR